MGNICCRIFKEQFDLINQLPEEERATVLYQVINNCFNQIENQIDFSSLGQVVYNLLQKNIICKEFSKNYGGYRKGAGRPVTKGNNQIDYQNNNQNENQNENAYISVSVSDIKDNIVDSSNLRNTHVKFTPPTLQEVLDYAKSQSTMARMGGFSCPQKIAEEFWTHYDSQGWVKSNDSRTPVTNWQSLLRSWTLNPNKFSKTGNAAPADYDLPL